MDVLTAIANRALYLKVGSAHCRVCDASAPDLWSLRHTDSCVVKPLEWEYEQRQRAHDQQMAWNRMARP